MGRKYQRLGVICKTKGSQLDEYVFDESLLDDGITEVYIVKKSRNPEALCKGVWHRLNNVIQRFTYCPLCKEGLLS